MKERAIRIIIGLLTTFIAFTAIGGGIAILTGTDKFPREWLEGTPFSSYTIPALILTLVVGGSSLLTAILLFKNKSASVMAAMVAGPVIMGFVTVESIMLRQEPSGPTYMEGLYFLLGFIVYTLSILLSKNQTWKSDIPD